MHRLLRQQIERFFGAEGVPPELSAFVAAVDEAYRRFDADQAVQAFPDLFFRLDPSGRVLDAQGAEADQVLPAPALRSRAMREVNDTGDPVRVEYSLEVRGVPRFFEARFVPAPHEEIVVLVRDITDHAVSRRELERQRAFLRHVIDLNPSFIFAKDRQGRFTLVNQAVADAYGTTVEELIGKSDADFNPNLEEVEHFRRDDLEVMDTRCEKVVLEETITDSAGRVRWLHTIKRPIVSADGRADQVLGVAVDITERKRLAEQLLQSQKMEAVGLLAGGVAHDFNNLLNVILGYTEMVSSRLGESHPSQHGLREVMVAGQRAAELTRKLLAFSRRQILQVKQFDLGAVVADFSRMLARVLGEDVEVKISTFSGPLRVQADPGQLEQVLLNLCTNARQAMPGGGVLSISMEETSLSPSQAEEASVRPGPYARLRVADTGIGMDAKILEHVFEPFFTTKTQGTGLGLSTVYGIVRQHGGFVRVSSELGRGTTIDVHLPRQWAAASEPVREAAPATGPTAGTETILVVEDEPSLRELLEISLSELGYAVVTAADGIEALSVMETVRESLAAVILDAVMPRMSGPEVYRRMRDLEPTLPVVFVSGHAPDSMGLAKLLEDEGVRFVPKPFSPRAVADVVRRLLDDSAESLP